MSNVDITPEDSYKLALDTMDDYDEKWSKYKKEEAKLLSNWEDDEATD